MSLKAMMAFLAISLTLLIPSALGDYQVFTIWHYNLSLDFGGENVTVEPQATTSDINSITRGMIFRGDRADEWGAAYLSTNREPVPTVLENRLRGLMMPTTKAIEIDAGQFVGTTGLIAAGDARVEHGFGQRCYGGAAIISPKGMGETVTVMLIGHFTNESLNKQLIQTARADYAPP
jgi:hypothetical protein